MKYIAFTFVFIASLLCSCNGNKAASEREQTRPEVKTDVAQPSDVQTGDTLRTITKEMAYEGVNNYCHKEYDWSVAKDNPDIMYVQMGEETDSTYSTNRQLEPSTYLIIWMKRMSDDVDSIIR